MAFIVPEAIEKYAEAHSSPLPALMEELKAETYRTQSSAGMLSGQLEQNLLQFLLWLGGAKRVLELGTFTGFSAQMMAAMLPPDGEVVTCDINPETKGILEPFLKRNPHGSKVKLHIGPGLETIKTLKGPFDLVFIDADKENYSNYYEAVLPLLGPKGIIAVDNVLWSGRVLEPKESSDRAIDAFNKRVRNDRRVVCTMVTIRDGIMLIRRAHA